MSGRTNAGDKTGWRRGAAYGYDGVGKNHAPFGKQRFEKDVWTLKEQAATQDKVVKGKVNERPQGKGSFKSKGIDKNSPRLGRSGKDWD